MRLPSMAAALVSAICCSLLAIISCCGRGMGSDRLAGCGGGCCCCNGTLHMSVQAHAGARLIKASLSPLA